MEHNIKDLETSLQIAMDKYSDMIYRIAINQMKTKEDADDIGFRDDFIYEYIDKLANGGKEDSILKLSSIPWLPLFLILKLEPGLYLGLLLFPFVFYPL